MDNYFSTVDLGLASFLDMSGIDLREVIEVKHKKGQYKFEFRIKNGDEKLSALLNEWNSSDKAKSLKRFAYSNKKLRSILREKLSNKK